MGDFLVHSHYTPPPPQGTWLKQGVVGTYHCCTCQECKYIYTNPPSSPTLSRILNIHLEATPTVKPLVWYMIQVPMELRRRILEHIGDISHQRDNSLAKHMTTVHAHEPYAVSFWVIEVVKMGERRGDLDRLLLQKETGWIFRLKSSAPSGLNDYM